MKSSASYLFAAVPLEWRPLFPGKAVSTGDVRIRVSAVASETWREGRWISLLDGRGKETGVSFKLSAAPCGAGCHCAAKVTQVAKSAPVVKTPAVPVSNELADLRSALLRSALLRYGSHDAACSYADGECTCGLRAAIGGRS